jgi:hypothetical protein
LGNTENGCHLIFYPKPKRKAYAMMMIMNDHFPWDVFGRGLMMEGKLGETYMHG